MLNNSKTFRLFISSTFSDFQQERETLQTKVFPKTQGSGDNDTTHTLLLFITHTQQAAIYLTL